MSWEKLPLGDLCSLITDGKHGDCSNEVGSGFFFLSAKDVFNGRLNYSKARQIAHDGFAETHRRTDLKPGDILLTNSGTIGRLAIARDDPRTPCTTFQKSVAVLKPIRKMIRSDFLYYQLMASEKRLIRSSAGAAQKNLLLGALRRFEITVPRLKEQERAATILSAYDDLIENNRQRIVLLEDVARQLYKEWFVRFRFPGHEHVESIDGVPKGWEQKNIDDVCQTIGGGTPSTKKPEFWDDEDVLWFTPTDVTRNGCLALLSSAAYISDSGLRNSSAKMVPAGSILMTSRASVGFFGINRLAASTNQGFINIIPNEPTFRMYLLQNLMWRVEEIRAHAGGATYKEISKSKFRGLPILVPTANLFDAFEEQAALIHKQVETLHIVNQQLVSARDFLLPKLMNGTLTV